MLLPFLIDVWLIQLVPGQMLHRRNETHASYFYEIIQSRHTSDTPAFQFHLPLEMTKLP